MAFSLVGSFVSSVGRMSELSERTAISLNRMANLVIFAILVFFAVSIIKFVLFLFRRSRNRIRTELILKLFRARSTLLVFKNIDSFEAATRTSIDEKREAAMKELLSAFSSVSAMRVMDKRRRRNSKTLFRAILENKLSITDQIASIDAEIKMLDLEMER
jgi:hypothetical protein